MMVLNTVSYDDRGTVISTDDTPSKTIFVVPDSLGWTNVSFVCEFAGSSTPGNPNAQQLKPGTAPKRWLAELRADAADAVRRIRQKK